MQSIFDTAVIVLILFKSRKHDGSGIVALIAKQGLVYYMYVCTLNHTRRKLTSCLGIKTEYCAIYHLDAHAHLCTGSYFFAKKVDSKLVLIIYLGRK